MRFQPDFLDELRLRLPLAEIVGRRVKLTRKGREYSGLCPFHNEKTPSFTVNEEKGFYHCFGCGAHGDVIRFVMETEGASFPETVERLAGEAGMPLPARSEEDREAGAKREGLIEVTEKAAKWFESQYHGAKGRVAREYLDSRGLKAETIAAFGLGYAPPERTALRDAMGARGITEHQLVEAGLVIKPDDGGECYDRFRHRVMFPITDVRGRTVAFGGRALGEAKAKYLNSPETPIFHKGRLLYNLANARTAARQTDRLIVVEGYMDVIALAQSGFEDAVAPLGTAITEQQIEMLWRVTPEPILCFDGDAAGRRASERAMERTLPLLRAAHSLRFAYLPEGEDPDSLVRNFGAGAFEDVLAAARTMVDVLWSMHLEASPVDTPERRAGFKSRMEQAVRQIKDDTVRRFYFDDLGARFRAFNQARPGGQAGYGQTGARRPAQMRRWRADKGPTVSQELLRTPLAQGEAHQGGPRERLLLAIILNHPGLLDSHEEEFAAIKFSAPELDKIRGEIIRIAAERRAGNANLESEALKTHLQQNGFGDILKRIENDPALASSKIAHSSDSSENAEKGLSAILDRNRLDVLLGELEDAELDAAMEENEAERERAGQRIRSLREQILVLEQQMADADNVIGL